MNLTITPDGPRGPRRRVGARADLSGVETGLADRRDGLWLRSSLAIEHLGSLRNSSAAAAERAPWSARRSIPADLDRDGVEHYRLQVERLLNRLTLEAEAWAESGTRKVNEVPLRREPIWRG